MIRFVILLVALSLVACSPPGPQKLETPPSVKGVLPGQTVWNAMEALGPLKWEPGFDTDENRVFEFASGRLLCRTGVIEKVVTEALQVGAGQIQSGDSPSQVASVWGPAKNRFERDGRELSLYQFKKFRYELEWEKDVLKTVEISREPANLGPGSPPFGKGTLGNDLRTEPGITLDGVALGWTRERAEGTLGKPNDQFWGASGSYGPNSSTEVGYADFRVHWVLGQELKQEEQTWVTVGMSFKDAAKNLTRVARLKQYSGAWVTYTFLNVGDVSLAIKDDRVVSIEMYDSRKSKK
jgi:hypothetical protein